MVVPNSTKTRLLELHRSGKHSSLTPQQLEYFYDICHKYLKIHESSPSSDLSESELYDILELHFYLALQTGHDIELGALLQQLGDRFEAQKSERLVLLKSVFIEATESPQRALSYIQESRPFMGPGSEKQGNLMILRKRELALSGRLKPVKEYTENLNAYLDIQPLDTTAWFELSRTYYQEGELLKSIHCLQEILLIQPFAYNIMARIGELYYMQLVQDKELKSNGKLPRQLADLGKNSVKYFSRSLELCSNFTRSWIGLYKVTEVVADELNLYKELNKLAVDNLHKLVEKDLISEKHKQIIKSILE